MKKYYHTLSKDKKLKVKAIYEKDYKNTEFSKYIKKLNIYIISAVIFSCLLFIDAFKDQELNIGSLIIAITLLIASLVFIIGRYIAKLNVLNKIALKKK